MVKPNIIQSQFANMVFVLAAILTLTFRLPLEIRIFTLLALVSVAVLSNRPGIEIAGVGMGIASLSFTIMFFFGKNPALMMNGQLKVIVAVIYSLILFASILHLVYQPQKYEK